jgi:hypothetical protein
MAVSKKYFRDHLILLLLSTNVFLAVLVVRLGTGHGTGYIVQYRSSLGINAFKTGSLTDLLGFIIFPLVVLAAHTMLSLRAYHIHKQLAVAILSLAVVLLVLNIIVSNALLVLR